MKDYIKVPNTTLINLSIGDFLIVFSEGGILYANWCRKNCIPPPIPGDQYSFRIKSLKSKESYVGERSYSPPAY